MPHSRDRAPGMWHIDQSAAALRAAGFSVEVSIDATPRAMKQAEAERAERMDARADRLTNRSARLGAESDARYDVRNMAASARLHRQAEQAQAGAESAAEHMRLRNNPGLVARRIERLEAERRKVQRGLDGYTRKHRRHDGTVWAVDEHPPAAGERREQLTAQASHLDEQLRYWREVLDQARAAGQWHPFERDTIRPGDKIMYRCRWWPVVRVNKLTVSVQTDYSWADKVPLREITDHQPAERDISPTDFDPIG